MNIAQRSEQRRRPVALNAQSAQKYLKQIGHFSSCIVSADAPQIPHVVPSYIMLSAALRLRRTLAYPRGPA